MAILQKLKSGFLGRTTQRRLTPEEYLEKLTRIGLNEDGTEAVDPVPMDPPIGYKKQPSMVEIVREMVRSERLAQEARDMGHETFEESEDFDVGDDDGNMMPSPWVSEFDPPLSEVTRAVEEERAARAPQPAAGAAGGAGGTPPAAGGGTPPEAS